MSDPNTAAATGVVDRWNRFWHGEGNTLSLGIFRALFAACLIWEIPVTRAKSLFGIEGGFHFPYVPFITPLPAPLYHAIHDWQYPFAIMLLLGVFPRIAGAALLILQGYVFFSDQLNFRNHPYFFLLILLFFVVFPSGQSFSIQSLWNRLRRSREKVAAAVGAIAPLTAQQLIKFQISVVYFYAAVHKMTEQYLGGFVLSDQMSRMMFRGRSGRMLADLLSPATLESFKTTVADPGFWVIPAWTTVILEVTLPFVLWIPRWRVAGMIFGIGFHISIAYVMNIDIFSAAMIASYLLFLDPETVPRVWLRARTRLAGRTATKVARTGKPKSAVRSPR